MVEGSVELMLLLMTLSWLAAGGGAILLGKKPTLASYFAYYGSALGSGFGVIAAVLTIVKGAHFSLSLWSVIPQLTFQFSLDVLSAFFLLIIAGLALIVSVYAPAYMKKYEGRENIVLLGAGYNIFILSMAGVVLSGNLFTFLILWETMSLISFFLVIFEHEQAEVRRSGLFYIIMTHIGTGFIIVAFLLLFHETGSLDFAVLHIHQNELAIQAKHLIFILSFIGFGTKAGLVPVHIWLPRAHPVAPTPISALLSAVMIKTALYGMIRVVYDFLGVASVWWGTVVCLIGMFTAVYGILHGVVQKDMKRFLAYSSVENMGLIFIGLGVSFIFTAMELPIFAAFSLLATLYHALNHAFFKGLLFMGAGAVYHATGTRNIERLGGLIRYMPQTAGLFLIGSLAIASFPPFNGFISKWMMIQTVLQLPFASNGNMVMNLLGTTGAAVLIFVGALVGLGFVKLFGVIFLAQPQTQKVKETKEVPLSMRLSMGVLAVGIVCLGIFPGFILKHLQSVTAIFFPEVDMPVSLFSVQAVTGSKAGIEPLYLLFAIAILLLLLVLSLFFLVGKSIYEKKEPWACGISLEPQMSYSGTSLSHPLLMIFKPFFGDSYESVLIKRKVYFTIKIRKIFDHLFYDPVVRFIMVISRQIRKIQDGSIHSYLAYIFLTLIISLLIITMT